MGLRSELILLLARRFGSEANQCRGRHGGEDTAVLLIAPEPTFHRKLTRASAVERYLALGNLPDRVFALAYYPLVPEQTYTVRKGGEVHLNG
jgi:hypothetical protein